MGRRGLDYSFTFRRKKYRLSPIPATKPLTPLIQFIQLFFLFLPENTLNF